jgi:hypothetical protein
MEKKHLLSENTRYISLCAGLSLQEHFKWKQIEPKPTFGVNDRLPFLASFIPLHLLHLTISQSSRPLVCRKALARNERPSREEEALAKSKHY